MTITNDYNYTYDFYEGENTSDDEVGVTSVDIYLEAVMFNDEYSSCYLAGYIYFGDRDEYEISDEYTITVSCGTDSIVVLEP